MLFCQIRCGTTTCPSPSSDGRNVHRVFFVLLNIKRVVVSATAEIRETIEGGRERGGEGGTPNVRKCLYDVIERLDIFLGHFALGRSYIYSRALLFSSFGPSRVYARAESRDIEGCSKTIPLSGETLFGPTAAKISLRSRLPPVFPYSVVRGFPLRVRGSSPREDKRAQLGRYRVEKADELD